MKKTIILIFIVLFSNILKAQNVTISGYVEDVNSGERLIGVSVFDANNTKYGTATNNYGYFSLTLPKGKHKITVSYIGYASWQQEFVLLKDTLLTLRISTEIQIGQVVVTGTQSQVESSQMSRVDVPINTIKTLPAFMGEVDVLKTLQLLPGVQGGTEGTSGIYVRGGGPDQNLILLDGVPVYNANHLFGFFSVFNADAISNVSLYKGGFPARYGGRLSSVIDISLKEGNMEKFSGDVSLGLISSKFTLEGPIKKGKSSFIISGRRTYFDIFAVPIMKLIQKKQGNDMNFTAGYYFYDFNAKFNYKFSEKDRLFLSLYGGQDKAYSKVNEDYEQDIYNTKMRFGWGNIISALRWNHVYSPKLFGNVTLTYSRFNFYTDLSSFSTNHNETQIDTTEFGVGYNSGINDWALKWDFDYSPNAFNRIRFGVNGIYHTFHPGETSIFFKTTYFDIDTTIGDNALNSKEFAGYMEDDVSLGKFVKVNIGGRLSMFKVRDTLYVSPEPRISARFLITDKFSFKLSYAEMKQYLHFLTNNTVGMPTDLWLPATDTVVPQVSYQYASGFSYAINKKINVVIEGFYKTMENLVELKEGESIFGDLRYGKAMGSIWESKVTQGRGWSYGGEFLIKKDIGKLTGWIGYTLSWSNRQFNEISFGNVFPYRYDKRHDLSIVATYHLNKNWNFGGVFVFSSGNPITLAQFEYLPLGNQLQSLYSYYETGGSSVQYFGQRNNYRLPAYHRLDLSANWTKKVKWGTRTWSFGIYNVYNHKNPFYADIEHLYGQEGPKLVVYSLFPIIPSISYKLEF